MVWTRRRLLGATGIAMGLAGCTGGGDGTAGGGGDGGDGGDGGTTPSPSPTPSPTATESPTPTESPSPTESPTPVAANPTVQVSSHPELGEVLVGPDGMTLYMFDPDERGAGASTCSGGCAAAWPPLTVEDTPSAGDGVTAELSTFEREDGSTQVAANGWPLYYFANDQEPGDATGQGVNDVWWVLRPDGTPVRPKSTSSATVQVASTSELGDILVGPEGLTLYMFDSDTRGEPASTCSGGCAAAWPPLTVDGKPTAGESVTAELSTFEREDGSTQVAANGWPLYFFASDEEPGDANGQGVNDVWWVLSPAGQPIRPESMESSDEGGSY